MEVAAPEGYRWSEAINGVQTLTPVTYVAQIGETKYETLEAAFAAVTDGTATTIEVLADSTGAGIVVPSGRNITVDFNGKSYTAVKGPGAGSSGTQNQVFQLLKDSTIVFNNGVIGVGTENATLDTYYRVIQNYADLTLNNMEVKGANLKTFAGFTNSVVESDNGVVSLTGTTKILDVTGGAELIKALNVDAWNGSYPAGTQLAINLSEGGQIGTIHCFTEGTGTVAPSTLTITAGTVGGLTVAEGNTVVVTKAAAVEVAAPEGYRWSEADENGVQTLIPDVFTVTFDLNGGQIVIDNETVTESFTQTVANGATAIEPNPAPTNGNQNFAGWFSDEQLSTPYNFDDPVTTAITLYAKWTTNGTCIVGKSIELNDSIRINVRLSKLSDEQHREYYHIRATFNGSTTVNGNLADLLASGVAVIRDGRYVIPVADTISYQITDLVHVVVSYGVDENNLTPIDEFDYSVQTYCENMISLHPSDAKLVAVCTATLDYGAYSQIQFNYKTENLANANYTAGAETISAIQIPDTYGITSISGTCTGIAGSGRSINLLSATEIRFTFRPENVSTLDNYTFTVNGESATATVNGNKFMVKVTGVKAPLLDTQYTVVITNTTDGTSMTATYSVLAYAYNMQSNSNANVSNMCKALYRYFDTAKKYFLA